jgi:nucleotide-binding universal stress UspA family protein
MLSKILVPVDGSENSFRALEQAIFLATKIQEAQNYSLVYNKGSAFSFYLFTKNYGKTPCRL